MNTNILVLSFHEESKAFQAFSELKQRAADQKLVLINAAVLQRDTAGKLAIQDSWVNGSAGDQVLTGTLLGSLVGLLLGPLGFLLGATTGALIGSGLSVESGEVQTSLIEQISASIPDGMTAVVATAQEYVPEVVDDLAASLGAAVLRRPVEAVEQEVVGHEKAQIAAALQARKVLSSQHKAEWHEKLAQWHQQFTAHLQNLKNKF
ncbi:DUF1269 domain-containing protein [Gluconobacter morbifer]|uniref:DUF1269 domain-containing protein n=1 Tax=Gluconobacter morbifer G707 TaxID=1088869 RepID=G6XH47_9PROT|nr:DUF1269 domain-containing protein [Gluconobacter morbifer]EHH69505.1 hypothetical protein GMO_08120 [Gluconobacter morbifer G707]